MEDVGAGGRRGACNLHSLPMGTRMGLVDQVQLSGLLVAPACAPIRKLAVHRETRRGVNVCVVPRSDAEAIGNLRHRLGRRGTAAGARAAVGYNSGGCRIYILHACKRLAVSRAILSTACAVSGQCAFAKLFVLKRLRNRFGYEYDVCVSNIPMFNITCHK